MFDVLKQLLRLSEMVHASHWVLFLTLIVVAGWWLILRFIAKRSAGGAFRCGGCWYQLDGLPSGAERCPECGGLLRKVMVHRTRSDRKRRPVLWAWSVTALAMALLALHILTIVSEAPPIGAVHTERTAVRYPSPPGDLPEVELTRVRVHRAYRVDYGRKWNDATNRRDDALLDFRCTLRAGDEELDLTDPGLRDHDVRAWLRTIDPSLSVVQLEGLSHDIMMFLPNGADRSVRLTPYESMPTPIDREHEVTVNGKTIGPGLRTRGLYGRPSVIYSSWWHAHNLVVMGAAVLLMVALAAYAPIRAHRRLRESLRAWEARSCST